MTSLNRLVASYATKQKNAINCIERLAATTQDATAIKCLVQQIARDSEVLIEVLDSKNAIMQTPPPLQTSSLSAALRAICNPPPRGFRFK